MFSGETIEQIARICHEANRAYCQSIGDWSQTSWGAAPKWQQESALNGVKFHLDKLDQGIRPNPAASHESWLKQKLAEGWKYGPDKDAVKKEHPCCVAYDKLPVEQKLKDFLFCGIVEAFYNGFRLNT